MHAFRFGYLAAAAALALAGVEAVSRERQLLRGSFTSLLVPAVRIGAFTFTGATEF